MNSIEPRRSEKKVVGFVLFEQRLASHVRVVTSSGQELAPRDGRARDRCAAAKTRRQRKDGDRAAPSNIDDAFQGIEPPRRIETKSHDICLLVAEVVGGLLVLRAFALLGNQLLDILDVDELTVVIRVRDALLFSLAALLLNFLVLVSLIRPTVERRMSRL